MFLITLLMLHNPDLLPIKEPLGDTEWSRIQRITVLQLQTQSLNLTDTHILLHVPINTISHLVSHNSVHSLFGLSVNNEWTFAALNQVFVQNGVWKQGPTQKTKSKCYHNVTHESFIQASRSVREVPTCQAQNSFAQKKLIPDLLWKEISVSGRSDSSQVL